MSAPRRPAEPPRRRVTAVRADQPDPQARRAARADAARTTVRTGDLEARAVTAHHHAMQSRAGWLAADRALLAARTGGVPTHRLAVLLGVSRTRVRQRLAAARKRAGGR